jgi:sigma-E factor negative regulatory protein RseA
MTERFRESLSALMDDEADDLELGRVLRAMEAGDDQVRGTWSRYQLVSAIMSGLPMTASAPAAPLAVEIEDRHEPEAAVARGSTGSHPPMRSRSWMSFAAAATVTLAVVLGWQWQDVPTDAPTTASTIMPSGPVMSDPRGILNAADGAASGPAAGASGPDLSPVRLRQLAPVAGERGAGHQVDAYMLYHAELSALNARSGMMPFARYASFQGAARSR